MVNILQSLAYKGGFYPDTPNTKGCDIHSDKVCYVSIRSQLRIKK
jgi:hypothetical protein